MTDSSDGDPILAAQQEFDAVLNRFRGIVEALAKSPKRDFKHQLEVAGFSQDQLRGHDWSGLDLSGEDLSGLDFSECDLRDVKFDGADLGGTSFRGARLSAGAFARALNPPSLADTSDSSIDDPVEEESIREYQYLVWYDIIDSVGVYSRNPRRREEVQRFNSDLRMQLETLQRVAASEHDVDIHVEGVSLSSSGDERHIFISGENARNLTEEVTKIIISQRIRHPAVAVRLCLIPCSFARSRVYRYTPSTNVVGEAFWTHWSRLRTLLFPRGERPARLMQSSILALCTNEFIDWPRLLFGLPSYQANDADVLTTQEPGGASIRTPVRKYVL